MSKRERSSAARTRSREAVLPWITTPILVLLFVAAWQFYIGAAAVSALILPSPAAVWTAWIKLLQSPRGWQHTLTTVHETLVGFGPAPRP